LDFPADPKLCFWVVDLVEGVPPPVALFPIPP